MSCPFFLELTWDLNFWKDIFQVVMVPFVVGLLAIFIPQRWQTRKRDSETKMQLVSDISEWVMKTIMTLFASIDDRKAKCKSKEQLEQDLNETFKAWRIQTCVINSKIHAYFPDAREHGKLLHEQWRDFSERVEAYYREWRERFSEDKLEDWEKRKDCLFDEKFKITNLILLSKITGFHHRPATEDPSRSAESR